MRDPTIVLSPILWPQINDAWPDLAPHFARACERVRSGRTPEDIRQEALADEITLWVIRDHKDILGALSTGFRQDGADKVLVYSDLGGRDMHRWLDFIVAEIERMGKSKGAARAEIRGRPGWDRKMRFYGYETSWVCLQKVL